MNKEMVIAKIRCWEAELGDIIATLNGEGKKGPIVQILKKRKAEITELIEAISDQSFITQGDVDFEPKPVMDEIAEKVKKVKDGVRKIQQLSNQKAKILEDLQKDS